VTTAIVVQARMGSTRLPGKVLMALGPHTVLEEVLRRCKAVAGADIVVCAVPDEAVDDALVPVAKAAGATVVRGSTLDVRARYLAAAEAVEADVVLRVTSDCPLIDPAVCAAVLAVRAAAGADYCANNMPASFPHGLDCEAFTVDALRRAAVSVGPDSDREHVTPWLRRAPEISRAAVVGPGGPAANLRWTLDWPEDLRFFRAAMSLLAPADRIAPWTVLARSLADHPEITAINASRNVMR
jgi:spore coat polysaccharide biosynthesis protein SpsF